MKTASLQHGWCRRYQGQQKRYQYEDQGARVVWRSLLRRSLKEPGKVPRSCIAQEEQNRRQETQRFHAICNGSFEDGRTIGSMQLHHALALVCIHVDLALHRKRQQCLDIKDK